MSYIALARKWRPRTFSQLIGQDHVNKALINSLDQKRLHHAYLFTGTRGVGKTSVARLLAKALNCEQGIGSEPCLQCDTCLSIEQGRCIDLLEIDGASKTRVEDTRELLDNVQYAPTSARFKIYLIDEVHMLSQHSFNALLKTLEEPPEHVKFLLATTDPQKLPVTVLSRCLQFHLNHLPVNVICQQLEHILQSESLEYEAPALELIARAAHGSMRDALSLLDHAIAVSDKKLQTQDIKNSLGYTQHDYALPLLHALANNEPDTLMAISQRIATESEHFHYVIDEILGYLHQISLYQTVSPTKNIEETIEIAALSTTLTKEDVQLLYQIGIKSKNELSLAPTLAIGFDMMLLRMYTFKPLPTVALPPLAHETPTTKETPISVSPNTANVSQEPITPPTPASSLPSTPETEDTSDWNTLLPQLQLSGIALSAVEHAEHISTSEHEVMLRVAKGHRSLFTTAVVKRIEQGLTDHYHRPLRLILNDETPVQSSPIQQRKKAALQLQEQTEAALNNDPFFHELQQEFSAELIKNSVESQ